MMLPDRIMPGDNVRDVRFRSLRSHLQVLLIFLRSLCDRNGRFEFDAAHVHWALYESVDNNVSVRDVGEWLEILRSRDFIKSYVGVEGRRVGEICDKWWQQKLKFGKTLFDPEPGDPLLPLADGEPPPGPPRDEEKRREVSVSRRRATAQAEPAHTHGSEKADNHLTVLAEEWPLHDVEACLRRAKKYVRGSRGAEAEVELTWFKKHWMPKEPKSRGKVVTFTQQNEPENFVEWFTARYEQAPSKKWGDLTAEQRSYYLGQMGSAARFSPAEVCA